MWEEAVLPSHSVGISLPGHSSPSPGLFILLEEGGHRLCIKAFMPYSLKKKRRKDGVEEPRTWGMLGVPVPSPDRY